MNIVAIKKQKRHYDVRIYGSSYSSGYCHDAVVVAVGGATRCWVERKSPNKQVM